MMSDKKGTVVHNNTTEHHSPSPQSASYLKHEPEYVRSDKTVTQFSDKDMQSVDVQKTTIVIGEITANDKNWKRFLALPLLTKEEKLRYLSDSINEALLEILDRNPEVLISYSAYTANPQG